MASKEIKARITQKHDTEANWNLATNFVPLKGEIIVYDADANNPARTKIGDGVTTVVNLPFCSSIPTVTSSDNGKVLEVVNGNWSAETKDVYVVTYGELWDDDESDYVWNCDHTYADIVEAMNSGRFIIAKYVQVDSDGTRTETWFGGAEEWNGLAIVYSYTSYAPSAFFILQSGNIPQGLAQVLFHLSPIAAQQYGVTYVFAGGDTAAVPFENMPNKVFMTDDSGGMVWGDFTDPSNIFAVTITCRNPYQVSMTFAETKAAYDAGKTVVLIDSADIAPLIEVNDSYMVFKYVDSSDQIISYTFYDSENVDYRLSDIVNAVNHLSGDVSLGLEAADGFLNIEGNASEVINGLAVTSISYDGGGSTFAQLLAVVAQSLASSNSCHLKMGNVASYTLAYSMYYYAQNYGAICGLMVSVNNLGTTRIILTPCGGGIVTNQGSASYRTCFPATDLGADVLVDMVLTITTEGQIYIDAEKYSNYTDLGGQTIPQLTAEIQQEFEAVTYADYAAMEVDNDYTIGGYTWRCTSDYKEDRTFYGQPQRVSYDVYVTLDSENEKVVSVDVSFVD